MEPESLNARIKRSAFALKYWGWATSMPWGDKALVEAIAHTEIGVLQHLCEEAPAAEFDKMAALLHDWDELRLRMLV